MGTVMTDYTLTTMIITSLMPVAIFGYRAHRVKQIIESRVERVLVPREEFNPDLDEVDRWAGLIQGLTKNRWFDWLRYPRFVCGIRFAHTSTKSGKPILRVSVPKHLEGLFERAHFYGLEIYSLDELKEVCGLQEFDSDFNCVVNRQLKLSNKDIWTVNRSTSNKVAESATLMTALSAAQDGQSAKAIVDIYPLSAKQMRKHKQQVVLHGTGEPLKLQKLTKVFNFVEDIFCNLFGWENETADAYPQARGVEAKVNYQNERSLARTATDDRFMFYVNVRLQTHSNNQSVAKTRMNLLEGAFHSFNSVSNNWKVKYGSTFSALEDLKYMKKVFQKSLDNHRITSKNVSPTQAIASLIVPATRHCKTSSHLTVEDVEAYDLELPEFDHSPELHPLGWTQDKRNQFVGMASNELVHSLICGGSGYGKTNLGLTQMLHNAQNNKCTIFLDPHGDATKTAIEYLADKQDQIVELSFEYRDRYLGWNPLATKGLNRQEREYRYMSFISGYSSAQKWGATNTRASTLLTVAVRTLIDISAQVPPHIAPTMFQIPDVLENPVFRKNLVPHLKDQGLREFWTHSYPNYEKTARGPVTNPIRRITGLSSLMGVLGQSDGAYDLDEAIKGNKNIFLRVNGTDEFQESIMIWVMRDILRAALARTYTPEHQRSIVNLYLDEVQSYESVLKGNIQMILEQLRKFGFKSHFMTQNPAILSDGTQQALFTNVNLIAATKLGEVGAKAIARQIGLSYEQFTAIDQYHFHTVGTKNGRTTKPIIIKTENLKNVITKPTAKPKQVSSAHPTAEQVLEHQATLKDRIIEHLESNTKQEPENHRSETLTYSQGAS